MQGAVGVLADRHAGEGLPQGAALAPGDAAGLGAAVDLGGPLAEALLQLGSGVGGQGAAGGEHPAHAAQGGPVEVVAHALEQGGAGDPGEVAGLQAGLLDVLGEGLGPAHEGAAGAQGPEHAEQQAVDVLGGDAGDQGGTGQVGAPEGFQGFDFVGQLAQGLVDQLGFAAGAGGAQHQAAGVQVQRGGGQGLGVEAIEAVEPEVAVFAQALAGLRLGVGRQQHLDAGAPGAQQGCGQLGAVFQIQRNALDAAGLEGTGQAQGLLGEGGLVQCRCQGDRASRVGLQQQVLQGDPAHANLRTRWRTSHSPANSRPISR